MAILAVFCILCVQPAALAEVGNSSSLQVKDPITGKEQPVLLADACELCGAPELDTLALAIGTGKSKNKSLLTDSLWGNLILELAYERDPQLGKLARKVKLMNFGTTASVLGIAGGTLAQGISAIYVLNPPDGKLDSYAPLNLGVALSGATMLILTARFLAGQHFAKSIQKRQIMIRDQVQAVLAHMEHSQGECNSAKDELKTLIGERATNEWIQLWQSSHKLAQSNRPRISQQTTVKQLEIAEQVP